MNIGSGAHAPLEPPGLAAAARHLVAAERAGEIVLPLPAISRSTSNEQVMRFWSEHPGQETAAVLDGDRPVGLLSRHGFMEFWARPFRRELASRKSCETLMDADPLVVDVDTPIPAVAAAALRHGARALRDGFIASRRGSYAGVGTGIAILEAASAAEAARAAQVLANVEYASLIQRSQLEVSREELAAAWPDAAILWEPRDVVGGDCHLFRGRAQGLFGAVIDCTGHGVSGAFMTLLTLSALERALEAAGEAPDPGEVLAEVNTRLKRVLGQRDRQETAGRRSDDGFDGACFFLPTGGGELHFAGARLPLMIASDAGVEVLEGERLSAGYRATPEGELWVTRRVALPRRGAIVLATDGLTSQPGGVRGLPFGRRRLVKVLSEAPLEAASETLERVARSLREWQGEETRRDDVTMLVLGLGRTT